MTEEEAKEKTCHRTMGRAFTWIPPNDPTGGPSKCIGRECMLFREHRIQPEGEDLIVATWDCVDVIG